MLYIGANQPAAPQQ